MDGVGERRVDKRVGAGRGVCRFDARRDATGRVYEYQCPSPALVHNPDRVALTVEELKAVRITSAEVEAVNRGTPCSSLAHPLLIHCSSLAHPLLIPCSSLPYALLTYTLVLKYLPLSTKICNWQCWGCLLGRTTSITLRRTSARTKGRRTRCASSHASPVPTHASALPVTLQPHTCIPVTLYAHLGPRLSGATCRL